MTPSEFMDRVAVTEGCWDWQGSVSPNGYGRHLWSYAHRLAYELFVGPIPDGSFVLHHCDRKLCVRPDHLYAGSHLDNMRDARERGRTMAALHPERMARGSQNGRRQHPERYPHGAAHPLAQLTDDDVRYIRRRYPRYSLTELARLLGVHRAVVYNAAIGKTWRHVTDVPPAQPSYRKGRNRGD